MANKLIGKCPICGKNLKVRELSCSDCDIKISGEFNLSKFDYLTAEQQSFALVFIKNGGNIKLVEKELNVSYPTVKKNLDELIQALGFDRVIINSIDREEIYRSLKKGEITFDEADFLLKEGDLDD